MKVSAQYFKGVHKGRVRTCVHRSECLLAFEIVLVQKKHNDSLPMLYVSSLDVSTVY